MVGWWTYIGCTEWDMVKPLVEYLSDSTVKMWLDFGKTTELSHRAYSILLAHLMATLIHYK